MSKAIINDVSDTAVWVAYYRALESERTDALFHDPFARRLVGERGRRIADMMKDTARYTRFSVVSRTVVIDRILQTAVANGVDTILNLGAGLDARPYRLHLNGDVRWIEVDYPHVIEHKAKVLDQERPLMKLERVAMDLADRPRRRELFSRIGANAKKVLVLTEGVLPYLTLEQVSELAHDLREVSCFKQWVGEYLAPETYKYINSPRRLRELKNAPFKFLPADWFGFFRANGWREDEIFYLPIEAAKLGRRQPMPWYAKLITPLLPKAVKDSFGRMSAYVVYVPLARENTPR